MRTVGWLFAVLLNAVIAVAAVLFAFEPEPSVGARAFAGAAAIVLLFAVTLLLLVRLARLPHWAPNAMRFVCASFPIVFLLGSLDLGTISGQELLSIILVSLFAWSTWRAFSLYSPKA